MDKNEARRKMIELGRKMMAEDDNMGLPELLKSKKPTKKVVVEADSQEGLEKGLSKAEEIMKKRSELLGLGGEEKEEEKEEESEEESEEEENGEEESEEEEEEDEENGKK